MQDKVVPQTLRHTFASWLDMQGESILTIFSNLYKLYLGQSLNFKAPVLIGDQVTASVEIVRIRDEKPIVTLRTLCINNEGQVLIESEAVLKHM
jgi:acyl dehydratase